MAKIRMKAYASFDLYLADKPPRSRTVIKALRAFVRKAEPDLVEAVKWSNGCWLKDGSPVAFVHADREWVQFGFIRGAKLKDPKGLLEGEGAYIRHVKVRSAADIDRRALGALLRQAVRLGGITKAERRRKK